MKFLCNLIGSLHKSKNRSCCKKLENERRSINTRCKHHFSEDGGQRKKEQNCDIDEESQGSTESYVGNHEKQGRVVRFLSVEFAS